MKKLYLIIFCMILAISAFAFTVSADSYYASDGYLTLENSNYNSSFDFYDPSSVPVFSNNVTVPDGYTLIAYSCNSSSSRSRWFYCPSTSLPPTIYIDNNDTIHVIASSGFSVQNNISSSGALSYRTSGSFVNQSIGSDTRVTCFVPVFNSNGDIVRPQNQINFNLNASYDTESKSLYFNASSSSYTSNHVSFYLFPSSVNISSGSSSTLISQQYINEIPVVSAELMDKLGLSVQYKIWEANRDISVFSLIPELVFLETTTSTRYGNSFDPSSFGVPYLDLGSKSFHQSDDIYITQTYALNIPNMDKSKSGVYLYNDLCVVAVVEYENVFFTTRFDFNRNILKTYGVVAPSYPSPSDSYSSGTVSDLQDLADYLQYLYTTNDSNRNKQDNNIIAYLQAIPWTNFVAGGTYQGLNDWLPLLSDSIDYTFGNLFSDYFIPTPEQMSELEDELEDDREEFESKFAFIDDVKDEVSFIFETIMRSGDQTRYFEFNLTNYHGVGVVQMNISDKIPSNVLTIVKNFITCFLTIAVVMHIFKTLPSTIGKMPSGGD